MVLFVFIGSAATGLISTIAGLCFQICIQNSKEDVAEDLPPTLQIVRAYASKISAYLYFHEHLAHKTAPKWSRCTKTLINSHDFETPRSSFGQNITKLSPKTYRPTPKIVRAHASKISAYECINTWRSSTFKDAFFLLQNGENVKIRLKIGRIM